jgi:histidine triad (HIT) family protein
MTCLFCNIINKNIPAKILFENDSMLAFEDIKPQAPHHFLLVPKRHIATIADTQEEDKELLGQMVLTAKDLALQSGFSESGYRLVFNVNPAGGQEIYHIHLHVIGGRQMTWPPG